jgi:hypothetical protein
MKSPRRALTAVGIASLVRAVAVFIPIVVADGWTAEAGGWRPSLHVEVDRSARIFVDGVRVDTLRVFRGQHIYWEKRDTDGPDLKIQFERKLIRERHPVRVVLSNVGRPGFVRVSPRARMKTYRGTPENGFIDGGRDLPPLRIRVIPPPAK